MLQTGGGAYYNRCPAMAWTGNLFENNTAKSGSAGLELNQCVGDVRQSVFFKNRVRCLAKPLANPLSNVSQRSDSLLVIDMHDAMITECLQACDSSHLSCKHLRREGL